MQLNSYFFIFVFLPSVLTGHWLLLRFGRHTAVLTWLLASSLAFYAFTSVTSLLLVLASILVDYLIASCLLREHPSRTRWRNLLLFLGVAINVAFLGYFKYKNFFLDTANIVLGTHFDLSSLLLPLGISFITFQKITFLADVHSGQIKKPRLLHFLLFTLFFPRIIAGPIVRYSEITAQLEHLSSRNVAYDIAVGICLFSIGLFKKVVIADGIARFVPLAFGPTAFSDYPPAMLHAWAGVLAYTFQLYFDFSGYSDMALGAARMFGVRLPMNFNSPLKATSIMEFWNRWHITLTRFLTAYIYTPIVLHLTRHRMARGKPILCGKRSDLSALAVLVGFPTLVTMTISGLWHGAGWQFVLFGSLHGLYLTINQSWHVLRPRFWSDQASYGRVMKPLGFILTFGAFVVSLVFFRAPSVSDALSILAGMAGTNGVLPQDIQVLHKLSIDLPWNILKLYRLVEPFVWLIVLFIIVTLAPNSLELLRRFHPALDFPLDPAPWKDECLKGSETERPIASPSKSSVAKKARSLVSAIARLKLEGASLNHSTALVTALIFILSVMALARSSPFVYGQF